MKLRRLADSGLIVSPLALGTLLWGRDTDVTDAQAIYERYAEAGGTTLDVPSDYASPAHGGRCQVVREVTASRAIPDPVLIVHSGEGTARPSAPAAHAARPALAQGVLCSRRHLLRSLDHCLTQLGVASVDLWVVHGPLQGVSHREVAWTLRDAVRSGRATYVGLADMSPWDYGALTALLADTEAPVSALSSPYSLLASSPARDLFPQCLNEGIGFVGTAPLAQGALTGKYRRATPPDSRAASAHLGASMQRYMSEGTGRVVEAVVRVAEGLDVSPSAVALAWALSDPAVSTCAAGPRTVPQLESMLEFEQVRMPRELREALTEVSLPG